MILRISLSLRILVLFSMIIVFAKPSFAQVEECVRIVGDYEFTPNENKETKYLSVILENGSTNYVAYQMDFYLPTGLEVAYYDSMLDVYIDNNDSFYPASRGNLHHSISANSNLQFVRILCVDTNGNRSFNSTSGELFKIGIRCSDEYSAYLKAGDVNVEIRNAKFVIDEQTSNEFESFVYTIGTADTERTLTLNVSSANKFGTCLLPFDVIPQGFEAYSCHEFKDNNLILSRQDTIKAYTPYVIYAEKGVEKTYTSDVDITKYKPTSKDDFLVGTAIAQNIGSVENPDQVFYVLQNQGDNGPMFYRVGDESFFFPPGKCWLSLPQDAPEVMNVRLMDATSVRDIPLSNLQPQNIFDLQGRKHRAMYKGFYIVDGKKVIK